MSRVLHTLYSTVSFRITLYLYLTCSKKLTGSQLSPPWVTWQNIQWHEASRGLSLSLCDSWASCTGNLLLLPDYPRRRIFTGCFKYHVDVNSELGVQCSVILRSTIIANCTNAWDQTTLTVSAFLDIVTSTSRSWQNVNRQFKREWTDI